MAQGQEKPADEPEAGKPAPHLDGPLASSGAAPTPSSADPPTRVPEPDPADPKPPEAGPADAKPDETKPADAKPDTTKPGEAQIDLDKPLAVTVGPSGRRVTRVLRQVNPIPAARAAGRTTHAWAQRPTGRLLIPAIMAALLIGAAGAAGAYLVPEALNFASAPSATPRFPLDAAAPATSAPSGGAVVPQAPAATGSAPGGLGFTGQRPSDALETWAQGVGTRVGIPVVAVQAYGYAELVAARTAPNCHLSWTTIAAIAKVESAHGSANGAVLGADGSVQPPIIGLPLDGNGGRRLIRDTDQGAIDADTTYDRAVGPLQFIPATWTEMKVDADNSGSADPNDIDDASLAAALYLCKGGRDLARADAWWDAILSYNEVRPYAQSVFAAANEYGQRSRV
ncbi:MAG TPA: murein transglycosylase [Actinoplanes sp.]|nr:murein transglycosylase [Actinoplanes sp.]